MNLVYGLAPHEPDRYSVDRANPLPPTPPPPPGVREVIGSIPVGVLKFFSLSGTPRDMLVITVQLCICYV